MNKDRDRKDILAIAIIMPFDWLQYRFYFIDFNLETFLFFYIYREANIPDN